MLSLIMTCCHLNSKALKILYDDIIVAIIAISLKVITIVFKILTVAIHVTEK